jgi:hypothetical protein
LSRTFKPDLLLQIRRVERLIDGCEYCHEDDADIPFDWILDKVDRPEWGDDELYPDRTGTLPDV